ncbi:GapS1 family protein [Paracidovorax oryzae]|uniref:GapS1 family protein n=1 Tax=Paracidovorax oryzae TaxID=862720 RepID=UPI000316AD16|nr:hypothetical protein [Paracidovorax oryzae]
MLNNRNTGLWPSRLLGRIEGTNTRTYAEAARYVRNQLRPFSASSIIKIALNKLHTYREDYLTHLKSWPWLSCLIIKLVIEDDAIKLSGKECSIKAFDNCLNALWDAQAGRDRLSAHGNVFLQMRAMLPPQIVFQRLASWDFLRFAALIDRLDSRHPTRILFIEKFGMDPHVFMCVSFCVLAGVLEGVTELSKKYYTDLDKYFSGAVIRFFADFARTFDELRSELRKEREHRIQVGEPIRPVYEYNEEPWLQRFPLIRLAEDRYIVWHPDVFSRGLENAVHRRLSDSASEYSLNFSRVFEAYVLEILDSTATSYLSESNYKKMARRDRKAVEAVITQDGVNILIEAKLTAYSEIVNISGESGRVWRGLKRIYEAMRQGWSVCSILKEEIPEKGAWGSAKENFLLIVTSQSMECVSGEHFRRWFGRDVFDQERLRRANQAIPTAEQIRMLPPNHIVVASIGEYEHLMEAVKRGDAHLPTVFRQIAEQVSDPQTSFMNLSQFLVKNFPGFEGSPVVKAALPALELYISEALGSADNADNL